MCVYKLHKTVLEQERAIQNFGRYPAVSYLYMDMFQIEKL